MSVFGPSERALFERGVEALENIANSLHKVAHPLYVTSTWAEQNPPPPVEELEIGDITVYATACEVQLIRGMAGTAARKHDSGLWCDKWARLVFKWPALNASQTSVKLSLVAGAQLYRGMRLHNFEAIE